jgi:hypothetical protein
MPAPLNRSSVAIVLRGSFISMLSVSSSSSQLGSSPTDSSVRETISNRSL